ncbi:MAG: prepilin-type N-terminal cleavage/methylation domain-containing protein [Parcubacteria group bacterium]|nr:prepilin-type N-terminal cleavage/methylation domain-containing protein [Parcubacteria group bacterium]
MQNELKSFKDLAVMEVSKTTDGLTKPLNPKSYILNSNRGFSLIELVVVMTIILVVGSFSVANYLNFRNRQRLDLTVREIGAVLRDAQGNAISQQFGDSWGVRFENPASEDDFYAMFVGASYVVASTTRRVSLPLPARFSDPAPGSAKNVIFSKATGLPSASTTIILELASDPSVTRSVIIDDSGAVKY